MPQDTIIDRLKHLISTGLDTPIPRENIGDNTPLFEQGLGLDSLILVELILLVEKEFSIKFSDAELDPDAFSTVGTLAEVIRSKQA